jgi:hypothetical protein
VTLEQFGEEHINLVDELDASDSEHSSMPRWVSSHTSLRSDVGLQQNHWNGPFLAFRRKVDASVNDSLSQEPRNRVECTIFVIVGNLWICTAAKTTGRVRVSNEIAIIVEIVDDY